MQIHYYKQPWGAWPKHPEMKRIGDIFALAVSKGGFEVRTFFISPALGLTEPRDKAYAMALFTRYLDMPADEVAALCRLAQADVGSKKVHAYQIMYVRSPHPPPPP